MMTTIAARLPAIAAYRPAPGAIKRALIAGSAWGVIVGAGLIALQFWSCGVLCIPDLAITMGEAVVAGILGIGPIAAFGKRVDPPAA